MKTVSIGEVSLIDTECDERHLNKITYANGDHISYEYDEKNRVVAVKENGDDPSVTITYADTARDSIRILHACGVDYQRNVINQKLITTEEIVCFNEEITKKQLKTTGIAKSSDGSTTIFDRYFGDEVIPFERVVTRYDKNGLPIVLSRTNHGETIGYQYDSLYRVEQKTSKCVSESGEKAFVTYYGYETISGNRKSPRICTEKTIGVGDTKEYKYSYYANGNLSEIRLNGTLLNKYRYDEYSRIIEEDNHELGSAFRYEYDSAGNIICKKKYEILNGVVQSVVESTAIYDYMTVNVECGHNAAWKDQLKRYNGDVISYDASGNPLNYFGKTFAWQGRKLIKVNSVEMAYDYNGLRVKKGDKRFYWQNGNLIAELWKENETEKFIYYFYDESGVCGFYYEGQEYHYYKNIFGDVLAVYAANGDLLCRYVYDAWGNHMVYDATGNNVTSRGNCIENINPFRYRGYYWDEEFGLYYLQSRYYDPVTGRFISPDSLKYLDPESVSGMNLYAYCGNNPVMNIDPTGTWDWKAIGTVCLIASAFIGGVAVSVLTGGIAGAVIAGALLGFSSAATANLTAQIKEQGWSGVNYGTVFKEGGIGAIIGALSGAFSYGFSQVASGIGAQFGLALSQTTHIGSGVIFGKVFGETVLVTIGAGAGRVLGTIAGAVLGDYGGNVIFGRKYFLFDQLEDLIADEIPGLIEEFLEWAL